jgi:predicted amidophosphoribosyltransferase
MPLHRQRIAERGFNQSMELARGVGQALGLPVRPLLVERDMNTPHQAGLPVKQRKRNLRGAFRCVGPVADQHVLLIDDVMTSGATLDELARTLKLAGAARVSNLVVARTLRSK